METYAINAARGGTARREEPKRTVLYLGILVVEPIDVTRILMKHEVVLVYKGVSNLLSASHRFFLSWRSLLLLLCQR